tara:strand:+ start:423 stop:614 length:192 start_codon:yes stop_codon:yes gene_type:complete
MHIILKNIKKITNIPVINKNILSRYETIDFLPSIYNRGKIKASRYKCPLKINKNLYETIDYKN